MQVDPVQEWQQLTAHYRQMSDDDLRDLACDFEDLTNTAQQALRNEMHSRGLGNPGPADAVTPAAVAEPQALNAPQQNLHTPRRQSERTSVLTDPFVGDLSRAAMLVPDETADSEDTDASDLHEYTWKTVLCECETTDQARELAEVLRQAGLDSWVQGSREFGLRYARVFVAADQLDKARAIAAQPIPQKIIDESKTEVPVYEPPKCPRCRTEDPVLVGVDPTNQWRCERCGEEWTDSIDADASGSAGNG